MTWLGCFGTRGQDPSWPQLSSPDYINDDDDENCILCCETQSKTFPSPYCLWVGKYDKDQDEFECFWDKRTCLRFQQTKITLIGLLTARLEVTWSLRLVEPWTSTSNLVFAVFERLTSTWGLKSGTPVHYSGFYLKKCISLALLYLGCPSLDQPNQLHCAWKYFTIYLQLFDHDCEFEQCFY